MNDEMNGVDEFDAGPLAHIPELPICVGVPVQLNDA